MSNKFFVKHFVEQLKKIIVFIVSNQIEIELILKSIIEYIDQLIENTFFNKLNQKKIT